MTPPVRAVVAFEDTALRRALEVVANGVVGKVPRRRDRGWLEPGAEDAGDGECVLRRSRELGEPLGNRVGALAR